MSDPHLLGALERVIRALERIASALEEMLRLARQAAVEFEVPVGQPDEER